MPRSRLRSGLFADPGNFPRSRKRNASHRACVLSQSKEPKVFFWHDPAQVLVGSFAGRQPKLFGAFLTRMRHSEVRYRTVQVDGGSAGFAAIADSDGH
jgi:hypothetical protein